MKVIKQSILWDGIDYPVFSPVVDGKTVKLKSGITCWWNPGDVGLRQRRTPIRSVLLHHTAGEGNGTAIYKTLVRRKLSVHFTVDADGVVTQHMDIGLCAFHAGKANDFTVGIEITNRGVYPSLPHKPRDVYHDQVRGHARKFLKFHPVQVNAVKVLTKDLCELLSLPYAFPLSRGGKPSRDTLTYKEFSEWNGMLCHLHVSDKKVDASPHIMDELVGV